jgi:imidazolonepropionase-like amidohydrolase
MWRKMTRTLVENIGLLVTNDSSVDGTPLGIVRDAAFLIEKGTVTWVGESKSALRVDVANKIDAHGRCIIPGFVDSHAHLIFAGDRSEEFGARMRGKQYSAGGIATTVEDEARQLVVARQLTEETTFLRAHIVPKEYSESPDDYVHIVCGPMLDAAKPNAKWIDLLSGSKTLTTLLPMAEFSTRSSYSDARRLFEAGVEVALASDCNPGSSYTTNMSFVIASPCQFLDPKDALVCTSRISSGSSTNR